MADFDGRLVVVAGASGALGQGLVTAFAAAGADVVGVTRSSPPGERAGVQYERADLMSDESVADLFERVGRPWAVVNTVGGFAPKSPLGSLDVEELTQQLNLNLTTAAILTKHALRVMRAAGQGRIVHTASRAAATKSSGFAYSVSKAGVLHLVKMAAQEVAATGIRVNAVSPSIIDTPANRAAMPGADHDAWPTPVELSEAYLYLASAKTRANGANLPV